MEKSDNNVLSKEIDRLRKRIAVLEIEEKKRLKIEDELLESKGILNSIINTIPDIVYRLDVNGKITFINDVIKNYNYEPQELIGKDIYELVHPDDLEKSKYCVKERRTGERRTRAFELRLLTAEQKSVPFEVRSKGLYDERVFLLQAEGIYKSDSPNEKTFIGTQALARDISDYKKMEAQLRQSQKMEAVGLLAGGVAHDFNNLLTVITGYTDLLIAAFQENGDNYKKLKHIRESAISASQLTAQLLAFSRRQILKPEVINLNDTIRKMKSILRRVIKESVKLELILDDNLNNIKTDPLQMEQIIMNLATNANDAMENGGTLTIETKNVFLDEEYTVKHVGTKSGAYVQMKIIDTGAGIDEKVLENIFEPFYTTKEMGRGTGLGLATVYGIIKQSGGNIWVDSTPGRGSSFNIYLPQCDEKLTIQDIQKEKKEVIAGNETILVVEDQQDILELISMSLSDSGYKVLVASDGNEAMKLVVNYKKAIHLLLTDVIMPNINGQELADNLSIIYPDLKVLYMSGYADNAIARLGVLDVDKNFIQKPFRPLELMKKIQEILNKK